MLRFLIIFCLAAMLASCQPVYETGYRVDPPVGGGEAAQACVASCEVAQAACLSPAREEFAACQSSAYILRLRVPSARSISVMCYSLGSCQNSLKS